MNYRLIWSKRAEIQFGEILYYLEKIWGERSSKKFIDKTNQTLFQIRTNPRISNLVKKNPEIRSRLITRHVTMYFEINQSELVLISFFQNKQDPEKLWGEV